jgi:transmembrane sensor
MLTEKINEIIAKQLNNEASPQEGQELERWLNQSEENKQVFDLINKDWKYNKTSYKIVNVDELKNKIWKEGMGSGKNATQLRPSYGFSFYLKIAATILVLAMAIFILIKEEQPASPVPVEWVTKSNPAGQKSKVFLPDGSEVWLNASSSLRYTTDFTDSTRIVLLSGEAFFQVVQDVNRPFTVISGNIRTTVLGTSFNINAFTEDVQVSLVSGKVKVAEMDSLEIVHELIVLNPGQSAIYMNDINEIIVQDFNVEATIRWKEGELYFNDASFDEIIKKLEQWYGVSIQVDERVKIQKTYSGTFKNESLKNVMESMSFSLHFDFEIKNKSMKIF